MSEQSNPSGSGHVPDSEPPREGDTGDRELTEYRQSPEERDRPGGREKERAAEGD